MFTSVSFSCQRQRIWLYSPYISHLSSSSASTSLVRSADTQLHPLSHTALLFKGVLEGKERHDGRHLRPPT